MKEGPPAAVNALAAAAPAWGWGWGRGRGWGCSVLRSGQYRGAVTVTSKRLNPVSFAFHLDS